MGFIEVLLILVIILVLFGGVASWPSLGYVEGYAPSMLFLILLIVLIVFLVRGRI